MLGDSENIHSVPEVELETLRSIYVNELEVEYNEGIPSSVALWLHPSTADNLEEQYVRIFLIFKLPEKYPDSVPHISIRNPRGLSDEQINRIVQKLLSIAESMKGASMLFELIEAAKEQLTSENRPSEDCAICLYGFMEGDVFTKTDCYHYFHSHCLDRYLKSKNNELNEDDSQTEGNGKDDERHKPLCPVCRVPITFKPKTEEFPEPIAVAAAHVSVTSVNRHQEEMEQLYQKQLAQGGIIDIEAEKNKFLLEIANVSTDKVLETQNAGKPAVDNSTNESACDKVDVDAACTTKNRKVNQSYSSNFHNHNAKPNFRGGYRQPYRKNYDRSDFREHKNFSTNNRYQNRRPRYNKSPNAPLENEGKDEEALSSEGQKDTVHSESYAVGQYVDEVDTFNDYRSSNHGLRNSRSKTNSHYAGSKNYYNTPSNRSYKNDGHWKSHGGNQKKYGENHSQVNSSPSHAEQVTDEKFLEKECAKNDLLTEANERFNKEENKPMIGKSYTKRYEYTDKRNNFRYQTRSHDEQNSQVRFPKSRENFQDKSNAASPGVADVIEHDCHAGNTDQNFNSRPYRPRYQDQHRRYGGNSRSYQTNETAYPSNDVGARAQTHSAGYSNYQQSNSSRYRGNSYSANKRFNEPMRNGNSNYKSAFKDEALKKESCHNGESIGNSPKVNSVDNNSEHSISESVKAKTPPNYSKSSDNCVKPNEKPNATMLRPPPGFANPRKKVVYGLPSINPPPGFGQS